MISNIENNLRLYLDFRDELDLVKVVAGSNDWDQRIVFMGVVKGKERLVDLLNEAEIDHNTVGGDSFATPSSVPLAYEITPQEMVETLDEAFRTVHETNLKILNNEQPTEEELSARKPISLRVFSSSTTVSEGLRRVQNWFRNHNLKN